MNMSDTERVRRAAKLLIKARALIEKGWTQGTSARDADGWAVGFDTDRACSWCALGAINRSAVLAPRDVKIAAQDLLDHAIPKSFPNVPGVSNWNDQKGRTREEVLEAFDKAIALGNGGKDAEHG